jgi:multiple sugar transport system permease protein
MKAEATPAWSPGTRRWRRALEDRRVLAPVLIAPAVIFMALVVGVPFGWAIYLSLTNAIGGSLSGAWVGFDNFTSAWSNDNFQKALRNTLIFTIASQVLVVIGAAILSAFLVRDFRGKWFIRFLVILPWAAPVVLSTIMWLWILDSLYSVVNWTLAKLHLDNGLIWLLDTTHLEVGAQAPLQWLGRPNLALIAITLVHAWRILPFAVVIFIAGRASIPNEVEDASKIDGATGLKKLWYVDVPLQLPIALVAVLFGIVFTAGDFAVVYILTAGGPFNSTQVLPTWAFQIGINSGSLGEGAAISLYLFPLLVVVSVAMLFFARRAQVSR